MAKLNYPPTKSNLISLKETHSIAKQGHQLLDQKREILVIELMSYLERIKRVEKELYELFEIAYSSLKRSISTFGRENIHEKTRFIKYEYPMKKKSTKIMGMHLPAIEVEAQKIKLTNSFLNSNAIVDETTKKFLKLISIICEMAEIRAIVWRLSKEVKKVQRRVNALEKVVLPDTEETMKFIEETLEEREREALFISKMVKARLEEE